MAKNKKNTYKPQSAPNRVMTLTKLQQAVALHQQGQLDQAKNSYEEILKSQPGHFDCLHLLGIIAFQTNNYERAAELISKAIAIDAKQSSAYYNYGNALKELRRLDDALASYDKCIVLKPDYAEAYNNRGSILKELGQLDDALVSYDKAVSLKPDYANAYNNRGNTLKELLRRNDALASYDKAISSQPDFADAYCNRGILLKELHRPEEALASYDKAIECKPDYAEAHCNRGLLLKELHRPEVALASYDRAIEFKPDYTEAYSNRGNVLRELQRLDDALASYDKAIALEHDNAETYNNRGNVLKELHRPNDALASYDTAIDLRPDYSEAYSNRGNLLKELKRLDESLASCDKAIALKPDYPEVYINKGNTLRELHRPDDALASYDKVLALEPDSAQAYSNKGIVLQELHKLDDALASHDKAIELDPDYSEAYNNRGNVLKALNRLDESLASYDKAITLKSDYAEVYTNRGNTLQDLQRLDEALACYKKAIELKPDYEFLPGTLLLTKMMLCDWQNLTENLQHLETMIYSAQKITTPFPVLALVDSPELHKQTSRIYTEALFPKVERLDVIKKREKNDRIRIGYFSADFRNHAMSYLLAGLFETHDSTRFELYGFSIEPVTHDEMYKRVSTAFETFVDVSDMADSEVVRYSRNLEIDIAVDLNGFTKHARVGIFAGVCAPLQVSYLGYPGTMGAPFIDYIIADKTIIPSDRVSDYSEKVVYLPNSYQVNDSKRKISDKIFTKKESGLPETGFVFCCFNNNYKILPSTFDGWMRILKAVEGSVLWLLEDNRTASINLRKEATARGVEGNRLIFAQRIPMDEHLARHRLADLFIDTLPYNAHTTASDALWAGLPVLTCMGQSFASRVAASLLTAIKLPELITHTQDEFEARAITLATDVSMLSNVKLKLERNRLTTPLFNTRLFAQHIEAAYETMYERYQADLPPESMEIPVRNQDT